MGLDDYIKRFAGCRVLVVGDVMLDEYVWGSVDRVSPEAPVQVVLVNSSTRTLGGAGNVVSNLAALGAKVFAVSLVGDDPAGRDVSSLLKSLGADVEGLLIDPSRPTTTKTRVMAAGQQVVRIDREKILPLSAGFEDKLAAHAEKCLEYCDAVLLSDYGKGILTPSILSRLIDACALAKKPVIADPKGLDFIRYQGATVLTPNLKEAAKACSMEILSQDDLEKAGKRLLNELSLACLVITRGPDGMALFFPDRPSLLIKARARQVFDVSGAGDTVLAVLGLGLASGADFEQAALVANEAAGVVVGKVGTATVSTEELLEALTSSADSISRKFRTTKGLAEELQAQKARGRKIVLARGCFDLLHSGHVGFLAQARKLGDMLVVALEDDASVARLKGPGRPILKLNDRVRVVSALDSVDFVTVFSGDFVGLLKALKPTVLACGREDAEDDFKQIVESYGGRTQKVAVEQGLSSAGIIEGIKNSVN
ncbi:MAG: D-glycero-beta-D-manno-heptose-7-phosphate kinase [Desulfatibacillaceae bacterium]|nr:D-glycero-beta-D-manno-heptose-7-phosphate kinase [Desulfatibacillaceae bacterium]